MGFIALITWAGAALAGLYMLAVWLIENDVTKRGASASRLPVPVVFGHLLLAVTGLVFWVAYLLLDEKKLAWAAVGILLLIALLGLTMFARWIPVYRGTAPAAASLPAGGGLPAGLASRSPAPYARARGAVPVPTGPAGQPAPVAGLPPELPAEGNFPVFMVFAHGVLAVSTLVLVVLTTIGIGGS
jgi:hypothetical protein